MHSGSFTKIKYYLHKTLWRTFRDCQWRGSFSNIFPTVAYTGIVKKEFRQSSKATLATSKGQYKFIPISSRKWNRMKHVREVRRNEPCCACKSLLLPHYQDWVGNHSVHILKLIRFKNPIWFWDWPANDARLASIRIQWSFSLLLELQQDT